jgi:hypothetical protein
MVVWFLVNVFVPFIPLGLVLFVSRIFRWGKGILDMTADGQLYFFSTALCGVFVYDAIKADKLDGTFFLALFVAIIFLVFFYSISMFVTHSSGSVAAAGALPNQQRLLARISIGVTVVVVVVIGYARLDLGLLA